MAFRDARHNADHYLVLGFLHGAAPVAHSRYLRKRKCFPIMMLTTPDRVYHLFSEIGGGGLPSHLGGNASARCGYHQKLGVSLTPGLWNAVMGISVNPSRSAVQSRQSSSINGVEDRPMRCPRWIPSSRSILLSFERRGFG